MLKTSSWTERQHLLWSSLCVEQEPGVVDQAAGDVGVVAVDGLEAGHDDLEQRELDPRGGQNCIFAAAAAGNEFTACTCWEHIQRI